MRPDFVSSSLTKVVSSGFNNTFLIFVLRKIPKERSLTRDSERTLMLESCS
uniref:Uncharacterized protein n=1 Tax=Amphimedon queenslandica TaxID=400682 RepID=A0A1X7UTY6_AMPQE